VKQKGDGGGRLHEKVGHAETQVLPFSKTESNPVVMMTDAEMIIANPVLAKTLNPRGEGREGYN